MLRAYLSSTEHVSLGYGSHWIATVITGMNIVSDYQIQVILFESHLKVPCWNEQKLLGQGYCNCI